MCRRRQLLTIGENLMLLEEGMALSEAGVCHRRRICIVKGDYACSERRIYAMKDGFVWVPIRAGMEH